MELVPGPNLADRIGSAGLLPPREAARLGRDVLAALTAAHAAGIHHRDVKPANVLLRPGEPHAHAVLTDFGIAALAGATALTATGEVVGSPEYVAPERIRGAPDAPPADLWSLGMTLYVAVEGASPLRRGTALATLAAVLDEPLAPPRRAGPLAPVLDALLVRDPGARPDAAALDGMLRAAADGEYGAPPAAPPAYGPAPAVPFPAPVAPTAPSPYTPTALDSPRPAPLPPAGGRRGGVVVGVLAAAVVLLGATVAALLLKSGGDGGGAAAGRGTESTAPAGGTGDDGDGDGENGDRPDGSADGSADEDGGNGADAGNGPGTGGTSGQPDATSPPSSSPQSSESPPLNDSWIAVLASEPVRNGPEARDDRLTGVLAEVPEAELLRSDDYPSLLPGYWVIHAPGPFADGKEAIAFCADRGRTAINACYGRYLSQDPDDRRLQCHPADGGSGRCSRE